MTRSEQKPKEEKAFLGAVIALLVFGLVMISSAGIIYSTTRFGDSYWFFKHQLVFGVLPGLAAMWLMARIDYRIWKKFAVPIFMLMIVLLLLVFVPGVGSRVYGASRWLQLGPFSFQPSEMAKLSVILYVSAWLSSRTSRQVADFLEGLVPFLGIVGVVGLLVLKQPDTGTFGVIALSAFAIFFVAGARFSHIAGILAGGVALLGLLVAMEPYRLNRLLAFLNPAGDPQGIGYQVTQALLAVGSGGFWGNGLGHSRQKFNYLPEPVTDSIFAVISEELGFVGAFLLVGLFVFIAMRGLRIAKNAPDEFGRYVAVGVTAWIVLQAFVNIGANVALIPLTGIPLPFVSYGGTSLLFLLASVGILLSISRRSGA